MTALCTTIGWLLAAHAPWEPECYRIPPDAIIVRHGFDGWLYAMTDDGRTSTAIAGWMRCEAVH